MLSAIRAGSLVLALASASAAQQVNWLRSTVNGHWYGVEYRTTSWTQGEGEAVSLGGHLATIRNQSEFNWVVSTFQSALPPGGLWIGLTDAGHEGVWSWVSGEPVTFLPWYPGQPQGGTSENCGILAGTNGASTPWSWHDAGDGYPSSRALIELPHPPTSGWSWPAFCATGAGPEFHCVADIDGDGRLDLIVPRPGAGSVAVVRNQGQGQFAPWVSFPTLPDGTVTAAADFDHDGHTDVAVASYSGRAVRIHRGDGLGGFVVGQTLPAVGQAFGVATADFDLDGWPDIAFTTNGSDSVCVALNNGAGTLQPPAALATDSQPSFVTVADVNGDGKPDFVVSNTLSNSVGVYVNTGSGGFVAPTFVPCGGANPARIGVGDFDRDGRLDLAVPNWSNAGVAILVGDGAGHFAVASGFGVTPSTTWIDVADVDDDDLPDLVLGHGTSTTISIYPGNGTSTFGAPITLAGPSWIRSLSLDDLDGDGMPDISAVGEQSGDVAVILNESNGGAFSSYCTAGTTSHGCTAAMHGVGYPSATQPSGFTLVCSNVELNQSGIVFYGMNGPMAGPWGMGTSFLCVKYPVERLGTLNSGVTGGVCGGTLSVDWNQYVSTHPGALGSPFVGGETVWAQAWFRDPPSPKTTNLSNGLLFSVCP